MNSFFRQSPFDWADALPAFSTLPPQDDIAANVSTRATGILESATTTSLHPFNMSGDTENPLYESPPTVATQTPWLSETIVQTRGPFFGALRAL